MFLSNYLLPVVILFASCCFFKLSEQFPIDEQHFEVIEEYLKSQGESRGIKSDLSLIHQLFVYQEIKYSNDFEISVEQIVPNPPRIQFPTQKRATFRGIFGSKKKLVEEPPKHVVVQPIAKAMRYEMLFNFAERRLLLATLNRMDLLRFVNEAGSFDFNHYETIKKLKRRLDDERYGDTLRNRRVDIIVDHYYRLISTPTWDIPYRVYTKNLSLESVKKLRVERVVRDICFSNNPWQRKNEQLADWNTLELFNRFVEPKSLASIWNQSVARATIGALHELVAEEERENQANVKQFKLSNVELVQSYLLEPCEYYVREFKQIFEEAEEARAKPTKNSHGKISDHFLYVTWTQAKVCKLLAELGAQKILEDAEH